MSQYEDLYARVRRPRVNWFVRFRGWIDPFPGLCDGDRLVLRWDGSKWSIFRETTTLVPLDPPIPKVVP